jgi:phosphoglycolate phosphatase
MVNVFTPVRAARAILFDLDGTLIDSRQDIARSCNFALASVGRPPLDVDVIGGFVGDGARALLARALGFSTPDETPEEAPRTLARALAAFEEFYAAHGAEHTTWMRGARESLETLSDRPVAIVTNKPRAATLAVLDALGARRLFCAIVAGGDGPLKPDPRAVTMALDRIHRIEGTDAGPRGDLEPADAWMIGDGPQDVLAGRAAGCRTIGVRGGIASESALLAAEPDVVLGSLLELPALVHEADQGHAPPSRGGGRR